MNETLKNLIERRSIKKYKNDEFYLFGDSSGGGLALAFLQRLKEEKQLPFPKKTVLMSPWADVSMTNEEIEEFAEKDPLLPLNGLIITGKQFAGELDVKDPLISPIYGNMDNLGEIFLIFGTNEILYPDCLKLSDMLEIAVGTSVEIKIGENLCHDWILAPLKESEETIDEIGKKIVKAIRSATGGYSCIRAIALELEEKKQIQVSMNMINYEKTPIHRVFETIKSEANRYNVNVVDTELVGPVPIYALRDVLDFYLRISDSFSVEQIYF